MAFNVKMIEPVQESQGEEGGLAPARMPGRDLFVQSHGDYFAGSVLKKSIQAASSGTSTLATTLRAARSIISTVPGSEPTPSTETNA